MSELTFHCCNLEPAQAAVRKRGLRLPVKPPPPPDLWNPAAGSAVIPSLARTAFLSRPHVSHRIINCTIRTPLLTPEQGIVGAPLLVSASPGCCI